MYNNQLFSVESFTVGSQKITVTVQPHEEDFQEKRISRVGFESWIERTGRLAVDNGMTYTDDQVKNEPIIESRTFPEYYQEETEVCADIYDYLLLTQGEDVFSQALAGMESALNDYKN